MSHQGFWGWFCLYQLEFLLLYDVIIMIFFCDTSFFCCVWANVVDLGGGLCRLWL